MIISDNKCSYFFQELQNEVSSLLEFKNVLLQTFPDLHHKISSLSQLSHPHHDARQRQNIKTDTDISDDIPSSWNTPAHNTGSMPRQRLVCYYQGRFT